jgi:pyruvate dehydrogenase E2 component (dihydrolipoamide acetyltransferase)
MTTNVLMPSIGPSIQAARLTRWLRREGDFVEAGDPIAEIAADRMTMDVEAPQTGILARILVAAGDDYIAVDRQIGVIAPGLPPHVSPPHVSPRPDAPPLAERPLQAPASPRARRMAHEAGVDLARVAGSGPGGRIIERDVQAALEAVRPADPAPVAPVAGGLPLAPSPGAALGAVQVHLEADCNLEALEALRGRLNESARENGTVKISLGDCMVKALAVALQRAPRANVVQAPRANREETPRADALDMPEGFALARQSDVALALAIDGRIVTPTVKAAEQLTLAEIALARGDFQAGRFSPAAFQGAASLVANVGAFGVKRIFPVVVAPWTLVLGVGAAEQRVIVEDGGPVVAAMLSVTVSFDRRAMDEMAGALLLAAFKHLIENPYGLML